jgi:hypothetical protein
MGKGNFMGLNKRGSWGVCWLVAAAFALSSCSHHSLQEPVPSFTSVFPYESREVGNYSVDNYTKAPLQWVVQAWVNTDAATLYAKSVNLEGIAEHVTWKKESGPSLGAQRMPGDIRTIPVVWMNLKERLLLTEPVSVHFYTILHEESSAPTPMDHYLGVVTTESIGKGSVITWRVYFDTTGWSPMASIMSSQIKRGLEKGFQSWIDKYGGALIPVEVKS